MRSETKKEDADAELQFDATNQITQQIRVARWHFTFEILCRLKKLANKNFPAKSN